MKKDILRKKINICGKVPGLNERQTRAVERLKEIDPECEIFWDSGIKIPEFIKGTLSRPSTESP